MKRVFLPFLLLTLVWAQPESGFPIGYAGKRLPESDARIGLALSGGAALGFAHIGVLKVLEREGIPVWAISGNSMGSLVGGAYAAGYRAVELESIALAADWGRLFSSSVPFGARYLPERQQAQRYVFQLRHRNLLPSLPSGLVPLQNVEFLLMELLSETEYSTRFDFDRLPIPYRAVAVDLKTAKLRVLDRGRLGQAIRASIAIPGVFAPERLERMELVDGGVQQYLPVEPLMEFRPNLVIAVLTMKHNPETGISLIDVVSRTMDVVGAEDLEEQKRMAHVLIEPNVDPFRHSDFARARGLIAAGEAAAEAALPEIRFKLAGREPVRRRNEVQARPLSVVRSVRFDGRKVTRESELRRLLETGPGRYLRFDRLRRDLVRVFNTGLFEDVNYRLDFGPADSVDVTIELEERAYGFYYLGIRYDNSNDVGLGVEVGQGNLGGSGASARVAFGLGNPDELRLGLTGTRLFMLPFGYRLDGYTGSVDHSYYRQGRLQAAYGIGYLGAVAEGGYILGRNAFFDVGFRVERAGYRLEENPPAVLESLPDFERIVGPSFRLEFNDEDDLDLPTSGQEFRAAALYSTRVLGATSDFLKVEVASERVLRILSRLRLRPGWELGFCLGGPTWSERFRLGGEDLAGFAQDEFTSGHKAVAKLSLDLLLFRLFNQDNYPCYLELFANGACLRSLDSLWGERDLKSALDWSVGGGILTNTPIGPLRFVVGFADFGKPAPDAGARVNLLVSVGREFRYRP